MTICKRCSSECDVGKYNTQRMKKTIRRTPYSLDMYCILQNPKNEQRDKTATHCSSNYSYPGGMLYDII